MTNNTNEALGFLKCWAENGPWTLTAIHPDSKKIETLTFAGLEAARQWIEPKQGIYNIYFSVNLTRTPMKTKAKKADIAALNWLHVDVDPRAGEDRDAEQARILAKLENFQPMPSVIVFSGGGYQAFWKLEEPVSVTDINHAEELEAYNHQLEILLGGDHCHNLDRIMRLPGTMNMPDERKRKKGRQPALATVAKADWETTYPLSAFIPAARVQSNETGEAKVTLSGNLPHITDLNDLPDSVSDRVKKLIVQGDDPENPTRYPSRSEALFAVCCELVKAGCDNDTIAALITDPEYGISESVIENPRPEQYTARQIRRAREHAIDPWLVKLNDLHAVIGDDGGHCRVATVVIDKTVGRSRISRQSFENFRNRYCNQKVTVGIGKTGSPMEKPLGHWWLDHPMRRQYDTIVFAPNRHIEGAYNLWNGFQYEAVPGDKHLSYLAHVRDNICAGNEANYTYVLNWLARTVQYPDQPGEVAIVLRGGQGTGKSFFAKRFGDLWGQHFLQVSDSKHLVGSFNGHLRDCVVLFGDEAFYAGDKKHEATLKTLITEESLMIEDKGINAVRSPNYVHLIMASNNSWVVPVGPNERRFLVLDVAPAQQQNSGYFKNIADDLENGGYQNLLYALKELDLTEWNHRKVPETEALMEQRQYGTSRIEQWMLDVLAEGITPGDDLLKERGADLFCLKTAADRLGVSSQKLYNALLRMDVLAEKTFVQPEVWVTTEGALVPEGSSTAAKHQTGPRMYRFKPLDELRKRFTKLYAGEWSLACAWSLREVVVLPF